MTYQDVLDRQGRVVRAGTRDCAGRYDAIAAWIERNGLEGCRVLDLGAYSGYFAQRLARECGCSVVAVDDWHGLAGLDVDGVEVINRRLAVPEVADLGRFDVTLLLSVLHHVPDWRDLLATVQANSFAVFVEPPDPSETLPKAVAHSDPIALEISRLGGEVIASTPGHRSNILRDLWVLT